MMRNWIKKRKKNGWKKEPDEKLSLLTTSFSEMLEIQELDALYRYIGSHIQSYYKNTIVLISKVNDAGNKNHVFDMFGVDARHMKKIEEVYGFNPISKTYCISPDNYSLYKTGKLKEIEVRIEKFASAEFPVEATQALTNLLGINKTYVIGIKKEEKLLSLVHIFTLNKTIIDDIYYLELFVNQAGAIVNKMMAESALKESEAHFPNLANMGQALIWTSGLDMKCNYFNKTWLEFTGRTLEQELGDGWTEGVHPQDLQKCVDIYVSSFNKRISFGMDYRIKRYDGEYRWIQDNGTPLFNSKNEFTGYIGHCLDITDRKNTEEELEKFRLGIEQANEVIFITGPDGVITYANPSFEKVYGYTPSEIIGKTPRILKSGLLEESKYQEFWKALFLRKTITGTMINKKKHGKYVDIEGSASSILNHKGDLLGFLAVHHDITERKAAELEITKLNKAIEQSPVSIIITNTQGELEYVNPCFLKLTGYSYDEVIGRNPRFLQSGEANVTFYKNIWKTILSGKEWRGQFKNKKKNGEIYYESAVISPVLDDQGSIINFVAVKEDITERRKVEEALKENEKILREAQQLSRTGHYIVNLETKTWSCSPVIDDILGIDFNFEKTIVNFGKLITPEYYDQMVQYYHLLPLLMKNFSKEFKIKRPSNGLEVWIYIKGELKLDEKKNPIGYIGTIQDITEGKKIEHDLMINNEKLESLLRISNYEASNIQDLLDFSLKEAINLTESKIGYIYLYDEETQLLKLNSWSKDVHAMCKIVNPTTTYELSKTGFWGEVIRQRKPIFLNNYSESHHLAKGLPNGHVPLRKFLSIPIFVNKRIVAVVGVANKEHNYTQTDVMQLTLMMDNVWKIVERKKMIEELVVAKEKAIESDNLKSAFLANVSHEIRTPMNAIMGFSELLANNAVPNVTVEKYANIIHSRSTYLLSLIDDILDLSKVVAGIITLNYTPFNLNELLDVLSEQTKLKIHKLNKDIEFRVEKGMSDKNSQIICDKNRIQQILTNLIENALKFTCKGHITLDYHEDAEKGIVFSVRDTGIGIPQKKQHLIFERFHKLNDSVLNYSGLGLGLSISKGIVNILGGEIWVDSKLQKGSIFSFNIPVSFLQTEKSENIETIVKYQNINKH